ncbi:MAG: hypothetical protein ACRDIU_06010 [Actinomycetota bacterium]
MSRVRLPRQAVESTAGALLHRQLKEATLRIRIAVSLVLIGSFLAIFPAPGGFAEFHIDTRRGGSLSAPTGETSPETDDEEKAEKRARKAARKAEEDQEEAGKESRKRAQKMDEASDGTGPQQAPTARETAREEGPSPQAAPSASNSAAEQVILEVFGPEAGPTAIRVARCESSMATGASNGSYAGLFQMGSYERSAYGHGSDPRSQAEAAYSYFTRSGWRPWSASRHCWA